MLPAGEVGLPYFMKFGISGGQLPYNVSIDSGHLPVGVALVNGGEELSGAPVSAGKRRFTLSVTDQTGVTVSKKFLLTIHPQLTIKTRSLPSGSLGRQYSVNLKTKGGGSIASWTILDGSVPAGLSFDTTSGRIAGTPAVVGTQTLTFRVTDVLGAVANKTLSISIR